MVNATKLGSSVQIDCCGSWDKKRAVWEREKGACKRKQCAWERFEKKRRRKKKPRGHENYKAKIKTFYLLCVWGNILGKYLHRSFLRQAKESSSKQQPVWGKSHWHNCSDPSFA